jgi:hypothetical protein
LKEELSKLEAEYTKNQNEITTIFENKPTSQEYFDNINNINEAQANLKKIELDMDKGLFEATKPLQEKLDVLAKKLDEYLVGHEAGNEIARLVRDVKKSKGWVDRAETNFRNAERKLLEVSETDTALLALRLKEHNLALKEYQDALDNQIFLANYSSFTLSYVSVWPEIELQNAASIILKGIITAAEVEIKGVISAWLDKKAFDVTYAFGVAYLIQSSNTLFTVLNHYFVNDAVKRFPIPTVDEDYMILNSDTKLPQLEIEVYRLRTEYIEPVMTAYIFLQALITKDLERLAWFKEKKTFGNSEFYDWYKEFIDYPSEEAFHANAEYKDIEYTMKAMFIRKWWKALQPEKEYFGLKKNPSHNISEQKAYEKNKTKIDSETANIDVAWKMKERAMKKYIDYSYVVMNTFNKEQWTQEELDRFPPIPTINFDETQ